ncbi:MAG: 2-polyprenyl-6-methoxyphenol hydroxylase-like FAD-dependent oxidoreductase [Candidatus Poriferisodalaceae bacterium]
MVASFADVKLDTQVLIVGGASVGLSLAAELGHHGVDNVVVEERLEVNPHPRANAVACRTMEYYRRWGIADELVSAGIPPENPADYYWLSSLAGREVHRLSLPSQAQLEDLRRTTPFSPTERLHWSPYIKCNVGQDEVEEILGRHVGDLEHVEVRTGLRFVDFVEHEDHVETLVVDSVTGAEQRIRSAYLVGCDGGRSPVRTQLGISYEGEGGLAHFVSVYFRAPELMDAHRFGPANIYFPLHKDHAGYLINWDRGESWTYHIQLGADEGWGDVDPVARITALLGSETPITIESVQPWTAHALTAESYGRDRVWLAGDAIHLFSPTGGFGMNTGVSDAVDLAWKLRGAIDGWGGPDLLSTYEAERRPVGVRNTWLAKELYDRLAAVMTLGDILDEDSAEADEVRATLKAELTEQESLIASFGVLLGYRYPDSTICVSDGTPEPDDHPQLYVPTSRPGHRAPHVWLSDDEALYDTFATGFNLVRTDLSLDVGEFVAEAAGRGIPINVVDVDHQHVDEVYPRSLTLVRPDLMVAWRDDACPDDFAALWDTVTGFGQAVTGF